MLAGGATVFMELTSRKTGLVDRYRSIFFPLGQPQARCIVTIDSQLYKELRETLERCTAFQSNSKLRAIFVDNRIALWKDLVPFGETVTERVLATVECLSQRTTQDGDNGLVLLLQVCVTKSRKGTISITI